MTSISQVVCEKCGSLMEARQEGSTQGLYCTGCDWSVVTTHIPEIRIDATEYEVRVSRGDYRNEQHVKAVSKVSNTNFLASRKLLQDTQPLVFRGEAVDVVRVREILVAAGISCAISPELRW